MKERRTKKIAEEKKLLFHPLLRWYNTCRASTFQKNRQTHKKIERKRHHSGSGTTLLKGSSEPTPFFLSFEFHVCKK